MELINPTSYPHLLFRTVAEKDKFAAAVMLRVTYDNHAGKIAVSKNQVWPLSTAPWQSPYGPMESDFVYRKGGVDLFVFGSARSLNKTPVKRMEVGVELPGKINHKIMVFGDRFWTSGFFGMGISDPLAFTEMPLTLSNAFGGYDQWDELSVPYPNNSNGKGFVWKKENAVGKPLPNIEDPKSLIAKWNDKPLPVGLVPITFCEKRIKRAVEFNNAGLVVKLDPLFFNNAFNDMIAPEVLPGEKIIITGVHEKGPYEFIIPPNSFDVELQFGDKLHKRKLTIDQVGIEPDHNRAFITYRYSFNYTMRPKEKRIITIIENQL